MMNCRQRDQGRVLSAVFRVVTFCTAWISSATLTSIASRVNVGLQVTGSCGRGGCKTGTPQQHNSQCTMPCGFAYYYMPH